MISLYLVHTVQMWRMTVHFRNLKLAQLKVLFGNSSQLGSISGITKLDSVPFPKLNGHLIFIFLLIILYSF